MCINSFDKEVVPLNQSDSGEFVVQGRVSRRQ